MSLQEFCEAVIDKDKEDIIKIERLKSYKRNSNTGEVKEESTHKIIVIWEGNSLPNSIGMYDNLFRTDVKPYIEPVKQCFNCYKYGHWKLSCNAKRLCCICGKDFHGNNCSENIKCVNCGLAHRSTSRDCSWYKYNMKIKKLMAEERITVREAISILKSENRQPRTVNRYDRIEWPEINPNSPEIIEETQKDVREVIYRSKEPVSYAGALSRRLESQEPQKLSHISKEKGKEKEFNVYVGSNSVSLQPRANIIERRQDNSKEVNREGDIELPLEKKMNMLEKKMEDMVAWINNTIIGLQNQWKLMIHDIIGSSGKGTDTYKDRDKEDNASIVSSEFY